MGTPRKPSKPSKLSPFIKTTLFFCFITTFASFPSAITAVDFTNLVYKGCANQKLQDPATENLKNLYDSLVSQSSQKTFFTTTFGEGTENAIMGTYQCRGDLTTSQCNTCVKKIPPLAKKLCGTVVAVRVQLSGCYLRYEVAGFKQVPGTEFLFKVCKSDQASAPTGGAGGFEVKRDRVFEMVESGVKNGSVGLFYAGSYQSVYALGQCEGDLSTGDCSDCVKTADQRAKNDCGNSTSVQIYLQKCYISYSFYPNGVPSITSSPGRGSKQHTQRTVAIVLGGVAAFGFLVVCLMFVRQLMKKHGGKHGDLY